MRTMKKDSTSQSVYFEVLDSTSTTGGRKTGLVFNTSSLTAYYARNGAASVSITLATLAAASSAWSSGGFKEVDATNMPGLYRLDVPDAALASGAESVVVTIRGATGMAQVSTEIQLNDNTSGDIFARVGAPAGASIAADISAVKTDTAAVKAQTDKLTFTVANQIDANVLDWKSAVAPAMTGDAFARLGAPAGASHAADVAAVKSDTGTILTDVNTGAGAIYTRLGAPAGASIAADIAALPAAATVTAIKTQTDKMAFTVAGMIDSNVIDWKGVAAPAMTGDAYARLGAPAGASHSADVAAVKSDTGTILTDVNTGAGAIYTRLGAPTGASLAADLAAVKSVLPSALVGGRIDANIGSVTAGAIAAAAFAAGALDAVWSTAVRLLTAGTNIVLAKGTGVTGFNDVTAASIWDVTISGHLTAGTTGAALNAAGSAGDPWSTPLPGVYGAGTAGNIIGGNLNATVSSRLASASYTAPDNADIVLIKAKTDNLPAAPADESLIIAATNALGSSIAALPNANANADALLDRANGVEAGWTLRQGLRIMLSALAGKASGLAGTTAAYRDMADAKNRISATVDANGDRSAVTLDPS